MVCKLIFKI